MALTDLLTRRHVRNPKEHSIENIATSILRFGFVAPPTIDESSGVLVAGHGRCVALQRLRDEGEAVPEGIGMDASGDWVVPVVRGVSFCDDHERDAYVVADNQLTIAGGWNADALAAMLEELEPFDLDGIGFDDDELAAIMGTGDARVSGGSSSTGTGVREHEDTQPPEPPDIPATMVGDVWILGDHLLYCGDCRTPLDVAFGKIVANVAITSPPYASRRVYDESSGFLPVRADAYVEWFDAVQANVACRLADDGSWFVNIRAHSDDGERSLYVYDLAIAHARLWGWKFIDDFCWRNTRNGTPGVWPSRFKNAWEPVFHFARSTSIKFRPLAVSRQSTMAFAYSPDNSESDSGSGLLGSDHTTGDGLARPSNVIEAAAESGQGGHTAPYPLALPRFFISAFSDEGDTVFEPFCGSGTTLIAAEELGRRCLAVEISPAYCDVIVQRWERLTGRVASKRVRE